MLHNRSGIVMSTSQAKNSARSLYAKSGCELHPFAGHLVGRTDRTRNRVSQHATNIGRQILVVDDCRSTLLLHCHFLKSMGFNVATATNAESAISLCQKRHFNFVLMDVSLPGMSGVEAARAIRYCSTGSVAPKIIFCSGYRNEDLENQDRNESWLTKPISRKDLERHLATVSKELVQ